LIQAAPESFVALWAQGAFYYVYTPGKEIESSIAIFAEKFIYGHCVLLHLKLLCILYFTSKGFQCEIFGRYRAKNCILFSPEREREQHCNLG